MSETAATIWVHPGRCGGSPCVYGTRITTAAIANMVWRNGPDLALECWPHLTLDDLKVACWYEATHGDRRRWKKRFGQWALDHGEAMWRSDWESVTAPPARS